MKHGEFRRETLPVIDEADAKGSTIISPASITAFPCGTSQEIRPIPWQRELEKGRDDVPPVGVGRDWGSARKVSYGLKIGRHLQRFKFERDFFGRFFLDLEVAPNTNAVEITLDAQ